jgi:hypothetical protein
MIKKIASKEVNGVQYDMMFFEGDHVYAIYAWDRESVIGKGAQIIPELARFSSEEDAREYFDKLHK